MRQDVRPHSYLVLWVSRLREPTRGSGVPAPGPLLSPALGRSRATTRLRGSANFRLTVQKSAILCDQRQVLYGAGLRAGEGLRLRCCDVDLHQRLLSIWNTKFFKSRLGTGRAQAGT